MLEGGTSVSDEPIWSQKGATLSDKSARQEFGLTQEEIIVAMRAGKFSSFRFGRKDDG